MANIILVSDVVRNLIEKYKGGKGVYSVSDSVLNEMNMEKGEFSLFRTLFENGVSVTTYKDGKKGSTSVNSTDHAALDKAVRECVESSESGVYDAAYGIAPFAGKRSFRSGVTEFDREKLFERMDELKQSINREYPEIVIMNIIGEHSCSHSVYRNTSGTEFDSVGGYYSVVAEFAAKRGEKVTSLNYFAFITDDVDTPFIEKNGVRRILGNCVKQLDLVPMEGKFVGTVVFTPSCFVEMLGSALSNFVSGSVIMDGTSIWKDRLDTRVASECLTVANAPLDSRILGGQRFTGDGFVAENYNIIENGVLKSFMLDLYHANKTGFKPSKNTADSIVIEGGNRTLDEIVSGIEEGILVDGFSGGEPSVNGDFSGVAKNSFLIRNGRIDCAVNEAMISGNLADMLMNITGMSCETEENGGFVAPFVACSGITVSGK